MNRPIAFGRARIPSGLGLLRIAVVALASTTPAVAADLVVGPGPGAAFALTIDVQVLAAPPVAKPAMSNPAFVTILDSAL